MKKLSLFLFEFFKPRPRRISLALVKVNCLLFALMLVALPVRHASAYLIDLHYTGTSITALSTADSVIGTPGSLKASDIRPTINLDDLGDGTTGHITDGDPFPGGYLTDFAVHVTGNIFIDTTEAWTFLMNHDDGARLKIDGTTVISVDGTSDNRDSLYSFTSLGAGLHSVDIVFFEHTGGASLEFFAAQGMHSSFNASFELIEGSPIPEPATMVLLGSGLIGLAGVGRKKFRK